MQFKLLKYILDIESVIKEIETIKQIYQNDFNNFSGDIILQRAVYRDLEFIGEAIRQMININPYIPITASKNIIGLRNIISHDYDSVEPEMLWGIIQKNIPASADEIQNLKGL